MRLTLQMFSCCKWSNSCNIDNNGANSLLMYPAVRRTQSITTGLYFIYAWIYFWNQWYIYFIYALIYWVIWNLWNKYTAGYPVYPYLYYCSSSGCWEWMDLVVLSVYILYMHGYIEYIELSEINETNWIQPLRRQGLNCNKRFFFFLHIQHVPYIGSKTKNKKTFIMGGFVIFFFF